ncbi:unnamed protein product [Heterobilharzia americana]|nr:unnamed protein product [Heterobilharzia americana]
MWKTRGYAVSKNTRMTKNKLSIVLLICISATGVSLSNPPSEDEIDAELDNLQKGVYQVEKIISENATYRLSDHYYYTQMIRLYQPQQAVGQTNLLTVTTSKGPATSNTAFTVHYHGRNFSVVEDNPYGEVILKQDWSSPGLAIIKPIDGVIPTGGSIIHKNVEVICTIYPNGNISFYYEKIPIEGLNLTKGPGIADKFSYKKAGDKKGREITYSHVMVPLSMVKSGTLVEFTPNRICSEQTNLDECIKTSRMDVKCKWCPEINVCSNGHDAHYTRWLNAGCRTKHIASVTFATTEGESDHGRTHRETNDNSNARSPEHNLFYLILIITGVVATVGIVLGSLWLLMNKRRRKTDA